MYSLLQSDSITKGFTNHIANLTVKADIIKGFICDISKLDDLPIAFNEGLWNSVIDTVTVYEDERLVFEFKNDIEIEEPL